jgi:hypothetical protein
LIFPWPCGLQGSRGVVNFAKKIGVAKICRGFGVFVLLRNFEKK